MTYTWNINKVFLTSEGSVEPTITVTQEGEKNIADIVDGAVVSLTDFVQAIEFTITGTNSEAETATVSSTAHLYHIPTNNYTTYGSITEAQLINWAKAAVGQGVIDNLEADIERKLAPAASQPRAVAW
jgi:uncharacterized phage protein gp47/JayE|tara:strand:+ start:278 stop:661 length:384 start_codon:yes stop_codon:yes gene_type:complete